MRLVKINIRKLFSTIFFYEHAIFTVKITSLFLILITWKNKYCEKYPTI